MKFIMFTKHLEHLSYEELADTIAGIGLDGVDLTVRSPGHVLPENVKTDLPKAAKAIRARAWKSAGLRRTSTAPMPPTPRTSWRLPATWAYRSSSWAITSTKASVISNARLPRCGMPSEASNASATNTTCAAACTSTPVQTWLRWLPSSACRSRASTHRLSVSTRTLGTWAWRAALAAGFKD